MKILKPVLSRSEKIDFLRKQNTLLWNAIVSICWGQDIPPDIDKICREAIEQCKEKENA